MAWRLRGLRRDLRVTAALAGRGRSAAWSTLTRIARSPARNGPWYLQRFGADALATVQSACEEEGLRPFLVFGSLLGQVREHGFIAHDDDVDLGMFADDFDELERVAARLRAHGFRSRRKAPFQWTFWARRLGSVPVDIFRLDEVPGGFESRALSHKGEHVYRLPAAPLASLQTTDFLGIRCWRPVDPEGFLAAHYGPDWNVPKPGWDYRSDAASELNE